VTKAKQNASPTAAQLSSVQYLKSNPTPERIALPVGQELLLVEVADIQYFESEGAYVSVFLKDQNKPVVLSKSLREFEELLNNPSFFRAHNSYLVNLRHIKKIVKADGGEIVMGNGRSLPVARAKKVELMGLISKV
jgi:two-component system LytT family response regulator